MTENSDETRREAVTAFFDSRAEAERVVERLCDEGLERSKVRLIEGRRSAAEPGAGDGGHGAHRGFWRALADLFMPEADRGTYAEGLSRGGTIVAVETTPTNREIVLDILDDEGTVDIDEREASWRSEGWRGYSRADIDRPSGIDALNARTEDVGMRSGIAGIGGTEPSRWNTADERLNTSSAGEGERLHAVSRNAPLARRDMSHGRTRLRSYIFDTGGSEAGPPVEIEDARPADAGRTAAGRGASGG